MPDNKNKKIAKPIPTTAFHGQGGDGTHVVGIGNLRVALFEEDGFWFAQGMEIDYLAQGDSLEDVKAQFENGLSATINEHLQANGDIAKMLRVAPQEVWTEVMCHKSTTRFFTQISAHAPLQEFPAGLLPFQGIEYLKLKGVA